MPFCPLGWICTKLNCTPNVNFYFNIVCHLHFMYRPWNPQFTPLCAILSAIKPLLSQETVFLINCLGHNELRVMWWLNLLCRLAIRKAARPQKKTSPITNYLPISKDNSFMYYNVCNYQMPDQTHLLIT